jgi:outer membrane protein insertion porin family
MKLNSRAGLPGMLRAGLLTMILWSGLAFSAAAQSFQFSSFQVDGNIRIDDATILEYADIPTGRTVSAAQLNDAFQRIQNSGLFETVTLDPRGSSLAISVVEYPTVNRISIEGNRLLDDDALRAVIGSSPRRVYSPAQATADAQAMLDLYEDQGQFVAAVTPRIIRQSDNRVDLVFEVSEGRVTEIERVSFVGNRVFSDRRLRRVLDTKQAGLFRTFIGRDTFVEDRIALDRQLLIDFYQSRGYVDFQVLSIAPEFSPERNATFLTFTVQEGQQFRFGEITARSEINGLDAADYLDASRIRSGRPYTPTLVDNTITRMERLALKQGRDFVRVEPRVTRNDRARTLDIEFVILRGPRVFVERIDIEGNQTTLDRVIRRQFRTAEGDPFNPREIRNTAERIRALGFFADVQVSAREGSASDRVIVDVDVEEQNTGSLGFGASYSVSSGVGLVLSFAEANLLGRGQSLRFELNSTDSTGRSQIAFTEPALLGRDVALTLSLSNARTTQDSAFYNTESTAAGIALTFPVGEESDLQVRYDASYDRLFNVSTDSSLILQGEAGSRLTSSVGYTFTYDTRTTGLNPNAGFLLSFGQDLAGLGGDTKYIRTTGRAIGQTRIRNEEVTLRATLEGGLVNMLSGDSTVTDRFFLSSRQLRGFAFKGVGPRDAAATNQDVLGGNAFVSLRLDSEFPLGLPEEFGMTGGLFVDAGSVWSLDNTSGTGPVDDGFKLRSSIGVALYWSTPIGPLTLSYARPIEREPLDETQYFDVTITTRF